MFRLETQYALRVLTELARSEGKTSVADLAVVSRVSAPMLAKVLHRLSRDRLVQGRPGPGGGYELARPASQIMLQDVVAALEGPGFGTSCLFGLPACSDASPCPLHGSWVEMRDRLGDVLSRNSLADLAAGRVGRTRSKKKR